MKTTDPNEDNIHSIENETIKITKTVETLYNTKRKVQCSDLSAGTQTLPVGKIYEVYIFRKDNSKISRIFIW